jgi:hypothetical protein
MRTTFLPIFVFDGPKRPDIKRGKKICKTSNKLIPGMKQIVEAFGFEWRTVSDCTNVPLVFTHYFRHRERRRLSWHISIV